MAINKIESNKNNNKYMNGACVRICGAYNREQKPNKRQFDKSGHSFFLIAPLIHTHTNTHKHIHIKK